MKRINKRYDEAVIAIVQSGFDDGSVRRVASARVVAYSIIGIVNWTHRWYRVGAPDMPTPDELGRSFVDMVLRGLATALDAPETDG